jgi:PAS domain S-box-containing protein
MRETGIDPVGSVSWGTHFCIFYQTKADLRDILVPYLKAGLENNEFCMWVTSEPLPVRDAKGSLQEVVKNLDEYIENEQMEILDYTQWYTKSGKFEADKVLQGWIEKENQALERGFAGFRLAGNTSWLENEAWRAFADYEGTIDRVIGNYRIIAACTYSLDRCGASEIIDVVCGHRFALIKREGKWEVIESAERKRAEDAVKSLAKFPDENPNPIVRVGGDGTVLYANKAAGLLLQSLGGAVGSPAPALWGNWVTQALASQAAQAIDVEHDGRVYAFDVIPITEGGYVNVYARDITERKWAEDALRVSHRFLAIANRHTEMIHLLKEFVAEVRNFTGCVAVGIRMLDAVGKIPYQAYEGFDQRFYESESPLSIGSDQCMCINVIKGTTDPKLSFYTESGSFYINGTTRFLATVSEEEKRRTRNVCNQFGYESVALVPIRLGDNILGLIHVADYQENMVPLEIVEVLEGVAMQLGPAIQRVRAEEALRESEERFRRLYEQAPLGYQSLDAEGCFIDVNQAWLDLLGYSRDQVIGHWFGDFLAPQEVDAFKERFPRFKATGEVHVDLEMVQRTGSTIIVHIDGKTGHDEHGQFKQTHCILHDITERKRVERESREKSAALERFTYAISHDLRSPLVTVKTFLGYLEQDLLSSDTGRIEKDMFYMRTAATKMGQLLDELLKILRIGHIANPPVRVTFRELVEEALNVVAGPIAERGVKVQVNDAPITLYGDRPCLVQIWQNLVENAVKFMGDQASPRIEIGAERRGGDTVFFVRDNGIGIEPRHQAKVFDLFEKIAAKSEGAGLGLALIKRIVELYRGTIWLESKGLGQGVCFLFTLPGAVKNQEEGEES